MTYMGEHYYYILSKDRDNIINYDFNRILVENLYRLLRATRFTMRNQEPANLQSSRQVHIKGTMGIVCLQAYF